MKKKKILFIDRDGTILTEPAGDYQVDRLNKFSFIPGVIGALTRLVKETDYRLVMVSNQDGLGTKSFPTDTFLPYQELMINTLSSEGVYFDEILIDDSFPSDNSPNRKPRTGMVNKYLNELLDYENSYVIGDRTTDVELAQNMGIKAILFNNTSADNVALSTSSWDEIYRFLKSGSRRSKVKRKTKETDICVEIDLNGTGKSQIETGIGFFNHMLEQIAYHGNIDLSIDVKGDLNIDEHHTIEDTAIVLGECFNTALGQKKGIERYAFALPMDEADATLLFDFGGRSCLVWNVKKFDREYIGDYPTEMTKHFFESFCQSAKCNLHITASGENTHHIIEGIFKAFARCISIAVKQTGNGVPSSKGVI